MTGLTTPPFQKRDSNSRLLAEKQKLVYNFLGEIFFFIQTLAYVPSILLSAL